MEERRFSTKGENRGLGLHSVKEIVSRYNNVYKKTSIDGEHFVQTLEIENKKLH